MLTGLPWPSPPFFASMRGTRSTSLSQVALKRLSSTIPLVIRVCRASTGLLVVGLVFVGLAQVLFDLVVKHPVFVELSD